MKRPLNHVIFLGAGASASSGYPIGQELRLLMSSQNHFEAELDKVYPAANNLKNDDIKLKCRQHFNRFSESIKLFRHGGFATVDEFSKLASENYPHHVQNMKKLMCLIFAMHNPEDKFEESEYYPFVQRLFRNDSLNIFRNNVTIITFNYDCYLDFLLRQAYRHRIHISNTSEPVKGQSAALKEPQELIEPWSSKLSSGFNIATSEKLKAWAPKHFNYFKLHGSIAYGLIPNFRYDRLFVEPAPKRFEFLYDKWFTDVYTPPVVFPWELFDDGGFISEEEFIFVKEKKDNVSRRDGAALFGHFKIMWEKAKQSVMQADKISFVGLSMHEYLTDAWGYLFDGFGTTIDTAHEYRGELRDKIGKMPKKVQVVIANPENDQFKNAANKLHPSSLCGKVTDMFSKLAPNLNYIPSFSEYDGILRHKDDPAQPDDPGITARYTFEEFIEREMD